MIALYFLGAALMLFIVIDSPKDITPGIVVITILWPLVVAVLALLTIVLYILIRFDPNFINLGDDETPDPYD